MTLIQSQPRAWSRLPSGGRVDLINPSPDSWTDADLATRLSRTSRWSGESKWAFPLSVAQHSLTVLALRRLHSPIPLSPMQALMELLHDAEEGLLGFDPTSPLKPVLGSAFEAVCGRLLAAVWTRYGLPAWDVDAYRLHKQADSIAAASEAFHCVGWMHDEIRNVLGITHPVLELDPLAQVYGCVPWEPWEPQLAAERFLRELKVLMHAASGDAGSTLTTSEVFAGLNQ